MRSHDWIDREMYPFESHYIKVDGGRMHYVDEGEGEPVVMLHGNPTWSFLYRHIIKGLSGSYRCIAPDYIGFGLSDKPVDWSYMPEDHARNVAKLIDELGLENITFVVQDWGGPIGMSYAVEHPGKVKGLVMMNTWMWSMEGNKSAERFSGFAGGKIGKFLIRRFNFFTKRVLPSAYADKKRLTQEIHRHYLVPAEVPDERKGAWVFPGAIIGSSDWLASMWEKREAIADKPALILWGMKDIAFRKKELDTWRSLLKNHKLVKLEDVGHYVQEEGGEDLVAPVLEFLGNESHFSPY